MNDLEVSFDEPPPSPIAPICFDSQILYSNISITSPKRKQRGWPGAAERRKKIRTFASTTTLKASEDQPKDPPAVFPDADCFPLCPVSTPRSQPSSQNETEGERPYGQSFRVDCSPYERFVDAVLAAECDFWQISHNLFIVNGWDRKARTATDTFYHLHMTLTGLERICYCVCPDGKQGDECFHIRFMKDHGDEKFPADHFHPMTDDDGRSYLFSRNIEQYEPRVYHNVFSIAGPGNAVGIKNRAIVDHYGDDTGSGTWKCSKDPKSKTCAHILRARDSLQQFMQLDESAKDLNSEQDTPSNKDVYVRDAVDDAQAVSYKRIPPPQWARISSDSPGLLFIPALSQPPELIRLTPSSSCPCQPESRMMYSREAESKIQRCEIYGLTRMWYSKVEIQKCPSCKHRFIGPDCQALGLFNWNNRVFLSYDLLDDYTSSFCSSETPFSAWASVLRRRYEGQESPLPFLSEKRFRSIWFAYARLLDLENDMRCAKCGPTPKVTIWDGVTLSFSRKNLKSSLCPPTTIHPTSKIRHNAKHPEKPQCINDGKLRKQICDILHGPPLVWINDCDVPPDLMFYNDEPSDDEAEDLAQSKRSLRNAKAKMKAINDMRTRINLVEGVVRQLEATDKNLSALFDRCYGLHTVKSGRKVPAAYTSLFRQIASADSVLQLISRPVRESLKRFIKYPTLQNASYLNMFPALYKVIILELADHSPPSVTSDLLGVCRWLTLRATTVLMTSITELGGEKDAQGQIPSHSWQKTGCCYSMPQIRYRPQYPSISNEGATDIGGQAKRKTGCGKYYSEYSQKRLTGGIMVVWCTHSICYGFHCIPESEGRDEVFSAIYTHWDKAPDIIVYDYACNLAPYIMAREPEFFADTKCLIDHFHSKGHSACGDACRLMTYVATNPDLEKINSSAAECGNSGLARIRKSVSYMTQDHAIIYTKVFLSIRNRLKIRKQEKEARDLGRG